MIRALREARGLDVGASSSGGSGAGDDGVKTVRYTRYPEAPAPTGWPGYDGHASWKLAYAGPELFEWLLRFSRDQGRI